LVKKGIRALGIAESFHPKARKSVLGGVVMRADLVVDGLVFGVATVGGDDATDSVLRMFKKLKRADVNILLLSGCIISRFNIVDVDELARRSGLPVICLTYNESRGIESSIRERFEHPEVRIEKYKSLGRRSPITLHTGYKVYVRTAKASDEEAKRVLDAFTLQGVVPEPVRVAKLLARSGLAVSSR
jgi:endonuclease V-like protein UPF0215 family